MKTGLDDFLVRHGGGDKARKAFGALPEHSMLVPGGLSFADLAAKQLPKQEWVVEELIPVGLTMVNGKPKIGKSFFAQDVSLGVATGGKVLGKYQCLRGRVLHLALEDTARRFQDRLRRMLDGAPAPAGAMFFNKWRRVEDHGLDALRRAIEAHRGTRLVVIDTFAKMRVQPTGRGNLYGEDYTAIAELKKIADEYSIAVVVIHHTRKAESSDQLDSVSGSTGLTGAADTILVLRRERIEADAVLFVTGRDVEEQEIALKMDTRTMRWKALGEATEYRMSEERKAILTTLAALGKPAQPSQVAELIGKKRGAIKVLMLKMLNDGQLHSDMAGNYTLRDHPRKASKGATSNG